MKHIKLPTLRAPIFRISALMISLSACIFASGGTNLSLVLPAGSEDLAGGGSGVFSAPIRLHAVYLAASFPQSRIRIKELHYRPSTFHGQAFTSTIPNLQITLSTTPSQPESIPLQFETNLGSNATVVFNGSITVSSKFNGPEAGPKEFDIRIPLNTPFLYDPGAGNLLVEYRTRTGASIISVDTAPVAGDGASRMFSTNPDATSAPSGDTGAEIIKLIYEKVDVEADGSYFSLAEDFSADSNPRGPWSYGWLPSLTGPFSRLTVKHTSTSDNGVVIPSWQLTASQTPAVYCNTSKVAATYLDGLAYPGDVWFYPGANGSAANFGAIRFVAPSNGQYRIVAQLRPVFETTQGDVDFHVLSNGESLFDAFLSSHQSMSYSNTAALRTGESLIFAIGRGKDNQLAQSGAKIDVSIFPSPNLGLPVDCVATNSPNGIAIWWPLDVDGRDLVNGENLVLRGNPAFSPAKVDSGMRVDGDVTYGEISARPSTDLGAGDSFTIEMWINPDSVQYQQPLLEWSDGAPDAGLHFWISVASLSSGGGSGSLFANLMSTDQVAHHIASPPGLIAANVYTHVAMTYAKNSGVAKLYANGFLVASTNFGSFTPETRRKLLVGRRELASSGEAAMSFHGSMDEISMYSRELSAQEILAISRAGCGGKSKEDAPPPIPRDFNLGRDFQPTQNPSGPWSYGWSDSVGGTFNKLTVTHISTADNGVKVPSWQLTSYQTPAVYVNNTTNRAVFQYWTAYADPGEVWYYPGENGRPENYGVIRFTAPSNSNYEVVVRAYQVYPTLTQGDTDFHVVKNGTSLLDRWLSGNDSVAYTGVVALAIGETLDFTIGRGLDGRQNESGLKLYAVISATTNVPSGPPSNCVPAVSPTGVVAWWPLTMDGQDVQGTNALTLIGTPSFVVGKVGGAMRVDGDVSYAWRDLTPATDLGAGDAFTIEMWINPDNVQHQQPLLEWSDGASGVGLHLWISVAAAGGGRVRCLQICSAPNRLRISCRRPQVLLRQTSSHTSH